MRAWRFRAARACGEALVDRLLLEEHAFSARDAAAARETVAQGHLDGVARARGVRRRECVRALGGCRGDGCGFGLSAAAGGDELAGGWSGVDVVVRERKRHLLGPVQGDDAVLRWGDIIVQRIRGDFDRAAEPLHGARETPVARES